MKKTFAIPQNNNYNLVIPNNYIGKKIEILFYAHDEIVEKNPLPVVKKRLSNKYRGILSKEQGQSLNEHIIGMRNEWNSIPALVGIFHQQSEEELYV